MFQLVLTVQWAGAADALDVPTPRPAPTPDLTFRMLGSESRQDGGESQVRFRWAVDVRQPGTFALDKLVPVLAYASDSPNPITVRPQAPLRMEIAPRAARWRQAAAIMGAVALAGGAGLAATVLRGRRARARAQKTALAARRAASDQDDDAMATAVRCRSEGNYGAYLDGLLAVAHRDAADDPLVAELTALRERIAFASYRPTAQELERAETGVRRLLDHRPTRSPEEIA